MSQNVDARAPATPAPRSDWTVQAADTIESVVGSVRSKTADPLVTVARGLVYGLLAAIVGTMALVLVAVAAVRVLDVYLPWHPQDRRVWSADLIMGGVFVLAGMFLWSRRRRRTEKYPPT